MIDITITQDSRRQQKKTGKRKIHFLRILFLSLILSLGAVWFLDGDSFKSAVSFLFNFNKNIVKYETYTVSFGNDFPEEIKQIVTENLSSIKFGDVNRFEFVDDDSDITLTMDGGENSLEVFSKDMIPVGHVYSLVNDISIDSLKNSNVYMIDDTFEIYLESQYGINIEVLDSYDSLVSKLKESDENIGLVDFSDLDFQLKVLSVDDQYYLDNNEGAISLKFFSSTIDDKDQYILDVLGRNIDFEGSVVDDGKLAKVNMAGVVAISRGLITKMNALKSNTYPADVLGEFLADADLTHVSNEASFASNCLAGTGMRFCSKEDHIETLIKSGVDIVELTGNHNNDYGSENNTSSINKYISLNMKYFGGGLNEEDASKILYEEVNGSKMAFVGYNYYDTLYNNYAVLAGEDRAGANSYSEEKLKSDINEAKENADIVIVTFQFQECYCYPSSDVIYPVCYKPLSNPDQKGVFRKAIDLGASIVVGTQAHQPQTYELYGDGVIFYGLGNLYFDQYNWIGTRQGLILTHYFYDGKYIQTKISPIYMDTDLQPELATEEQGDLLMELLKEARDE